MGRDRITILDGDDETEVAGNVLLFEYMDDDVFGVGIPYENLPDKDLVNNPGRAVGYEIVATGMETRSGTVIGAQQTVSGVFLRVEE